jgi:hypothetical protein
MFTRSLVFSTHVSYRNMINQSGDVLSVSRPFKMMPTKNAQPRPLHFGHLLSICGAARSGFQHRVRACDLFTYHTAEGIGGYTVAS